MKNSNLKIHEGTPFPLLHVENISEHDLKKTCRIFSLSFQKLQNGYLVQSERFYSNFKFSYLDLFFAAISFLPQRREASFFLFERNVLREELEVGIFGKVTKETSVENKIKIWQKKSVSFSLSGFAQAALHQAGLLSEIKIQDIDLKYEDVAKFIRIENDKLKTA